MPLKSWVLHLPYTCHPPLTIADACTSLPHTRWWWCRYTQDSVSFLCVFVIMTFAYYWFCRCSHTHTIAHLMDLVTLLQGMYGTLTHSTTASDPIRLYSSVLLHQPPPPPSRINHHHSLVSTTTTLSCVNHHPLVSTTTALSHQPPPLSRVNHLLLCQPPPPSHFNHYHSCASTITLTPQPPPPPLQTSHHCSTPIPCGPPHTTPHKMRTTITTVSTWLSQHTTPHKMRTTITTVSTWLSQHPLTQQWQPPACTNTPTTNVTMMATSVTTSYPHHPTNRHPQQHDNEGMGHNKDRNTMRTGTRWGQGHDIEDRDGEPTTTMKQRVQPMLPCSLPWVVDTSELSVLIGTLQLSTSPGVGMFWVSVLSGWLGTLW